MPNRMQQILAVLEAAPEGLSSRQVCEAVTGRTDRFTRGPIGGLLCRLEELGLVQREGDDRPIRYVRVPNTVYRPPPRTRRRDYRSDLDPRLRAIGPRMVLALRIAHGIATGGKVTPKVLYDEFGVSLDAAQRWIRAWKYVKETTQPPKPRNPRRAPATDALAPII